VCTVVLFHDLYRVKFYASCGTRSLASSLAVGRSYASDAEAYMRRCRTRAGMRQLLEERMNELVLYINSLMRDSTINPFRYVSATSTRILSGEEEGVFEWITVNYLLGSFAGQSACVSWPSQLCSRSAVANMYSSSFA